MITLSRLYVFILKEYLYTDKNIQSTKGGQWNLHLPFSLIFRLLFECKGESHMEKWGEINKETSSLPNPDLLKGWVSLYLLAITKLLTYSEGWDVRWWCLPCSSPLVLLAGSPGVPLPCFLQVLASPGGSADKTDILLILSSLLHGITEMQLGKWEWKEMKG